MANKEEFENYEEIEERIQKYDNFCRRVITKNKPVKKKELVWTFLTLLIHGQREIYFLNKSVAKEVDSSKEIKELLIECKKLFGLIEELYATKNKEIIARIHDSEKKLVYKTGYNLLEKKKGKETILTYHILAAIRNFYQANSPLIGLII